MKHATDTEPESSWLDHDHHCSLCSALRCLHGSALIAATPHMPVNWKLITDRCSSHVIPRPRSSIAAISAAPMMPSDRCASYPQQSVVPSCNLSSGRCRGQHAGSNNTAASHAVLSTPGAQLQVPNRTTTEASSVPTVCIGVCSSSTQVLHSTAHGSSASSAAGTTV